VPFTHTDYDGESLDATRQALLRLAEGISDNARMFGTPSEVDPVRHLIGTALGWGGLPEHEAFYVIESDPKQVGNYTMTFTDRSASPHGRCPATLGTSSAILVPMIMSDPTEASRVAVPPLVADYLVYVVVLNLFVQFVPQAITESFSISLLTAALLLLVLHVVAMVKTPLKARFKAASAGAGKVLVGVTLWLVLVASKFVVLKLVDLVFDDRVSLGGFVSVTVLILVMLFARDLGRRLLARAPVPMPAAG